MSIRIHSVRISGLRGIKNIDVTLPRVAVLIGPNNSGKTSFLKAMQLALGDYSRFVCEEDFYIGADEKRVSNIIVVSKLFPLVLMEGGRKISTRSGPRNLEIKIRAKANLN